MCSPITGAGGGEGRMQALELVYNLTGDELALKGLKVPLLRV